MDKLQHLQQRIERFQTEKFTGQLLSAKLKHLEKEIGELQTDPDDLMEWADVFILLLGSAAEYGLNTDELIALAHKKMNINDSRTWGAPDAEGVCHHIE
ncbi:MAG TPA: dATP/dGTP pyrophosphohydrolase domain-containing protein [Verrucomicrobiae bacterium]|jgi:hypothetical protein|nr:dATP/dGTP pyrophosphohydrolase domain-containing protein [Verrucomicrobiae bacterium]